MNPPDQDGLALFEARDLQPATEIRESEYKRLLGFPQDYPLEGRSRELADWARHWYRDHGHPWLYVREAETLELSGGDIRLERTRLGAGPLHDQLRAAGAHTAVLAAVSAGPECEAKARELWQEGKPDEYFFLEMFGSAVVEHLITHAGGKICSWAESRRTAVLPHYSPGYAGWEIADQAALWQLIRSHRRDGFLDGLRVLDSGMLQPKKSLLAVFGVTRHLDKVRSLSSLVPCENCSLAACQYRRVPYRRSLPQIEDVRRLQGAPPEVPEGKIIPLTVLNHNACYSVNVRALEKWSKERLELSFRSDGTVDARFRYGGTTCSNMGRPLEFIYELRLGPAEEGYPVVQAECAPAPDDIGYEYMCEYLNNARSLMDSIAREKPLLGRPINDALNWQRPYSPSGCYCDADRRAHKWGLVYEVVHFALVRYEQQHGRAEPRATALE
jgi:hypothetical protein